MDTFKRLCNAYGVKFVYGDLDTLTFVGTLDSMAFVDHITKTRGFKRELRFVFQFRRAARKEKREKYKNKENIPSYDAPGFDEVD
jgi:hypothetical protein